MPQTQQECIKNDPEGQEVAKAYHLDSYTSAQILSIISKWIVGHLHEFNEWVDKMYDQDNSQQYKQLGTTGGQFVQRVFPSKAVMTESQDNLQEFFNGFFEVRGLEVPEGLSFCFDDQEVEALFAMIESVLEDLNDGRFRAAKKEIRSFFENTMGVTKRCFFHDEKVQELINRHGGAHHGRKGPMIKKRLMKMINKHHEKWEG
mmetsp:Transcript_28023/g.24725  ORF Transcript_28023/g.24725 Transcript_28023/m.24725 type:complete len:203 (-) Transcript_28023:244-852(-)